MQQVSSLVTFLITKTRYFFVDKFFLIPCGILQMNSWGSETIIKVPNKKVEGWALPEMPGQEYLSSSFASLIWVVTQRIIREACCVTTQITAKQPQSVKRAQRGLQCVQINSICFAEGDIFPE